MPAEIWMRSKMVVNTDLQRRCYNGCNFSERIDYGEWRLFQTWDTLEFAERVAKGLRCDRYDIEVKEKT